MCCLHTYMYVLTHQYFESKKKPNIIVQVFFKFKIKKTLYSRIKLIDYMLFW